MQRASTRSPGIFPKPLLEVGGKSIIDRLLTDLDSIAEISGHVIVTNATFFPHFADWKAKTNYTKEIVLLNDGATSNENRLGAVKDILFVIESLALQEELLVLAGDNVVDFSFRDFVRFARQKGTSCITRHYEPSLQALQKTGVLTMDAGSRVLAIQEKPRAPASNWAVPPFYLYKESDLDAHRRGGDERLRTRRPGQSGRVAVPADRALCLGAARQAL